MRRYGAPLMREVGGHKIFNAHGLAIRDESRQRLALTLGRLGATNTIAQWRGLEIVIHNSGEMLLIEVQRSHFGP